jgi:hypothetical protein
MTHSHVYKVFADILLDMCDFKADVLAKKWAEAVTTSQRTPSFHSFPVKDLIQTVTPFYKNIRNIYFAEDTYTETLKFLEKADYFRAWHSRGIPLHEAIYALIMMRRHIWLYADLQSLFYSEGDIYQAVISINRVLVVFDYAIFILASKYGK